MTTKQRKWFYGLAAGFFGGMWSSIDGGLAVMIIAPKEFNLDAGLMKTLTTMGVLGFLAGAKVAVAYLKQSPLPPMSGDTVFIEKPNSGTNNIMKIILAITVALGAVFCLLPKAHSSEIGLEPYGTISWVGLDNKSDLGAGANLTLGITKNLSIVAFGEGDSTSDPRFFDQIDRAGAGLRYTAWLGTRVSLDAGVAGAWDIQNSAFFLRLPLGASLYAYKSKNVSLGVRAQYAFDISGEGPNGKSTGRAFAGPVFSYSF